MARLSKAAPGFRLLEGFSAETSGGLLVVLSPADAENFLEEIERIDGHPAWIVGRVTQAGAEGKTATISKEVEIIEV